MKRFSSYLFLAVGATLILLMGGCTGRSINPASHVMLSTSDAIHVSLVGSISEYRFEYFQQTFLYMKHNSIKNLHIHLYTPGGEIVTMIAILDMLEVFKAEGIHITTYNNGACMSAGVPIFLMGDVRIMRPRSVIMIHPPSGIPDPEDISLSAHAAYIRLVNIYRDIVVNKTKITTEEIMKIITGDSAENETYFFAYESLALGIATKVE